MVEKMGKVNAGKVAKVWKTCSCVESKEGRCQPKGQWVIKLKSNICYKFPTEAEADNYLKVHNGVRQ